MSNDPDPVLLYTLDLEKSSPGGRFTITLSDQINSHPVELLKPAPNQDLAKVLLLVNTEHVAFYQTQVTEGVSMEARDLGKHRLHLSAIAGNSEWVQIAWYEPETPGIPTQKAVLHAGESDEYFINMAHWLHVEVWIKGRNDDVRIDVKQDWGFRKESADR